MPTGYTADISKGITFRQYALNCARAFGALIAMRDDPADAPIPERFEPTDYHANELQQATDRLAQLRLMSPAEAEQAATAAYNSACEERARQVREKDELRAKYEAMLAQVVAWKAPTPDHIEYKNFMEKQIRESIDWDCRIFGDPPQQFTGAQWLAEEIRKAEWAINYHIKHDREERERVEGRNGWVKALRDSLPAE